MSNKSKIQELKTLSFPKAVHTSLLELVMSQKQAEHQIGTILNTFFATAGVDPKKYQINLEQNILTPVVGGKEVVNVNGSQE